MPGEEERDPGEATVASGSRNDAVEDSRRREGILDWDLAPGAFCPELAHVSKLYRSEVFLRLRLAKEECLMVISAITRQWAILESIKHTRHFLFLNSRR